MANVCGNTYLLKPSERDPGASMVRAPSCHGRGAACGSHRRTTCIARRRTAQLLTKLAMDAGLPKGVCNVIHGAHDAVNFVCDHPAIKAISFVGGNAAGEYIHARGSANGKRVQANLGAKNHATVMPDADKEATLNALAGEWLPRVEG